MTPLRILVPEAQAMGSLACIRSLGRAGHQPVAMAQDPRAQGFRSRYCHERVLQPPRLTGDAMAEWLQATIAERRIDLIIPTEGLVTALGAQRSRFAALLPVGPDVDRIERFISKFALFDHFLSAADPALRRHLPDTVLLRADDAGWRDAVRRLSLPLFAKFDAIPAAGLDACVHRFDRHDDAVDRLAALLDRYGRGLAQAFAPGRGVGVFFLRWNGQVRATLMHRRLHEVPHTGGVSSYRETWWDETLHADALRRIESMGWWGVGMLEYRWNDADRNFQLMEFNARFWGSLHLALWAGVDFPRLLVEAWQGTAGEPVVGPPGVRCRYTFPKEVEYLWSLLRDADVGGGRKAFALAEFLALGLMPSVHSDLWFPGDRGLYWQALRDTPGKFLRRR